MVELRVSINTKDGRPSGIDERLNAAFHARNLSKVKESNDLVL
jgi:hypothetical protein